MAATGIINKIVVRGTNWIGDAVMSVPALRELSRIFPDAEITLHTKTTLEGLYEDADFIDRLLTIDGGLSKIKRVIAEADNLEKEDFDLAILLPNSFESAITARLARVPRRIGYNKDLRGLLLSDPLAVPEWKDRRHEVYYYLNLIAEAERRYLNRSTVSAAEPDISLVVSETRQQQARAMLRSEGVDTNRRIVAIGAGSTNSMAKRWHANRFAELIDQLQDELDATAVLVGSPTETDVGAEIQASVRTRVVDLIGRTGIAEAAALLSVCDLLVSNDMGLAHVAPAVGTRSAVIFGPTNPITTRPFSDKSVVISAGVECSPCMLRECPIDHRCMTRVTVEHAFSVCRHHFLAESV